MRSTPDEGSTFTLAVPELAPVAGVHTVAARTVPGAVEPLITPMVPTRDAAQARSRTGRGRPQRLADEAFAGVRVLVVDDDFRNVFAMSALLERSRAYVTVAENGPDAIAIVQRMPDIDIVLMDIMMPIMDGYAAIRAIRALGPRGALPIVAITGKVSVGERSRCLAAGADDYVTKPVDITELLAVLRPWLPSVQQAGA